MSDNTRFQIITFYEFKDMSSVGELPALKESLSRLMTDLLLRGTIILSNEGFNFHIGRQIGEY
jgi:predicted sulfurtransferase